MQIGEYKFDKEFIKWETEITHVTPRKSIAFEWLVLEVIAKAQGTEFAEESLYNLFTDYFQITNANKLITPAIRRLYDLQAIEIDITNEFNLRDYAPKDVTIQPLGLEMHKKGLLPGTNETVKMDFFYDVKEKKLDFNNHKSEKNSIVDDFRNNYDEDENPDEMFPATAIRNFLNEKIAEQKNAFVEKKTGKGKKKKINLDWVEVNTELGDVSPISHHVCYEPFEKDIILTPDFKWHIEGCKDIETEQASLKEYTNYFYPDDMIDEIDEEPAVYADTLHISDADKDIEQIILNKDLFSRISRYLGSNKINFVEADFYDENKELQKKEKEARIIVVSGSNENSIKLKEKLNTLIIKMTDSVLPAGTFYRTENFEIVYENFPITAGDYHRDIPFAYIPRKKRFNVKDYCLTLIRENAVNIPALLFLLPPDEIEEQFIILTKKMDGELAKVIHDVNNLSKQLLNKKVISDSCISKLLINEEEVIKKVSSSMDQAIIEINNCSYSGQILKDYIEIVIKATAANSKMYKLTELYNFLDTLRAKNPDLIGYFDNKKLLISLYSDINKKEVVEMIFEKSVHIQKHDFDKQIYKLYESYDSIKTDILNGQFKKIKDNFNTWNVKLSNLNKTYKIGSLFEKYDEEIKKLVGNLPKNK